MNKKIARSMTKIHPTSQITNSNHPKELLPILTSRQPDLQKSNILAVRKPLKSFLSSPEIQKSTKKLLLMKKMDLLTKQEESEQEDEQKHIIKRLQSGKQSKNLPELIVLTKNTDRQTYLKHQFVKQSLVGQEAINKFYQRYKQLDRRKDKQDFFNEKHALTNIISLLQMHNFTPRKLTIVKMKGHEAILDLKKFGLGQGSMGPVVIQILNHLHHFEEVDLSYNRINGILGESIIQKLGKAKIVNMSHNRISKVGCQKFSQLFLTNTTKIQELNLEQNSLLDNAGAVLIQHLLKFNNLRKLNLNKNMMGQKFAKKMKQILMGGQKQLQELYLSWNQFNSKAVKYILEGVSQHSFLKVFDFSWNKIEYQNAEILAKVFQEAYNLVHIDVSFCQLGLKSVSILAKALNQNHTLFGLHFEGNSGYIDHKGYIIATEKEFNEYPLPIIKGIIRRIDGVKPYPTNEYKVGNMRDVCWICHSWQQKYFCLIYNEQMKGQVKQLNSTVIQCYIHFKHQNFRAVKMFLNQDSSRFEVQRMCPIGLTQFFYTFSPAPGKRYTTVSSEYQIISSQVHLEYHIGKINVHEIVKQRNNWMSNYDMDPIDENYNLNIDLLPRSLEVGIGFRQGQKVRLKRKIMREQKMKVNLKDIGNEEDDDFLKDRLNRDDDEVKLHQSRQFLGQIGIQKYSQEYLKRCIDFDVENSKISRLIKEQTQLNQFKIMMLRYYKSFKDTFYSLSKDNPSQNGIYSMTQLSFTGFIDEQKYITKRVNQAKIMLKLYACLSIGDDSQQKNPKKQGLANVVNKKIEDKPTIKLISRPQFLQFLVRLAIEKWCSYNPNKKKKPIINQQKLWEEQQKKMLQMKRSNSKILKVKKSQKGNLLENKSKKIEIQAKQEKNDAIVIDKNQQKKQGEEQQQDNSEDQQQMKKIKLKLPLPLIDGIERTMGSLVRYGENYRSSLWRKVKYLKVDNLIVFKAYDQFLNSLFDKYTQIKFKTNKPKKLITLLTLDELKNIFLDTGIRKTKEAMKEMEQAFLDSKRLEIEDGNIQYGLCFQQFQECIARVAEILWFNPPSAPTAQIWDSQINRKNTPLFLKIQAFIVGLYWRIPELHNRRMAKIVEKGIFEMQISILMSKIQNLSLMSGSLGLNRRNSMLGGEQICLKDVIEELRQKFQKQVILHEDEEEYQDEIIPN